MVDVIAFRYVYKLNDNPPSGTFFFYRQLKSGSMQNYPSIATGVLDAGIPLQQIVNNFITGIYRSALENKSEIINEIDKRLLLSYRSGKVISIMTELVETVVRNSKNGEIHITADRYSDVIVFQIEERNNNNGYALSYSIGSIEPDAAMIGGHISIRGPQQKVTTISFSFPNLHAA
jgi:hypothetical protein